MKNFWFNTKTFKIVCKSKVTLEELYYVLEHSKHFKFQFENILENSTPSQISSYVSAKKELCSYFNLSKLTNKEIKNILYFHPDLWSFFNLNLLTSNDISFLLSFRNELKNIFDVNKLPISELFFLACEYNHLHDVIDFRKFDFIQLSIILKHQPHLRKKFSMFYWIKSFFKYFF